MNRSLLGVVTLGLLHACAASSPGYYRSAAPSYVRGSGSTLASAHGRVVSSTPAPSAPGSWVSSSSDVTAQESSQPSRGPAAEVDPRSRPGLATTWGEDVYSRVRHSQFERASEAPFDTAAVWYNDARMLGMQVDRAAAQAHLITLGPSHNGVRVSLRGEHGGPLQGVSVNGRTFVLGESGQRYTILLENRTGASFEALVTVDGLDVVNGQPGSYANRGYVLRPYAQLEIRGFRQSLDRVAAFRFGSVGESYAADRGDARNVGVIGVALFAERGAVWESDRNEVELREQASPFPNGFAPPPQRRW